MIRWPCASMSTITREPKWPPDRRASSQVATLASCMAGSPLKFPRGWIAESGHHLQGAVLDLVGAACWTTSRPEVLYPGHVKQKTCLIQL